VVGVLGHPPGGMGALPGGDGAAARHEAGPQ